MKFDKLVEISSITFVGALVVTLTTGLLALSYVILSNLFDIITIGGVLFSIVFVICCYCVRE